ncbi:peptide chain release factor 2 [Haliovirga abyssi]|nr:peptide chain release factor 2 [Haliovirga abyssi]
MDILEIKRDYEKMKEKLEEMGGIFDLANKKEEIKKLEKITVEDGFWNDKRESEKIIKELNILKEKISEFENIESEVEELEVLIDFVESGETDFEEELEEKYNKLVKNMDEYDTKILLSGDYDINNAIVTIHSGAGGTEACDWADMLYRMYSRWCNDKKYKIEVLDRLDGDGAGIKAITFLVKGEYSYGYLKSEKGVHRLVRISPFDSNKRRHTSFASVDIMPEVDDNIEIVINSQDLRIDTYRASGAGGQHVNMTDSAVRITHLPTKTVVTCQNQRSQIQNRETAMKILKSKLFEMEMKKKEEELKKMQGEMSEIGWGNQIRSYVFQPYTMVKDHRTNFEIGNVASVMDGNIDGFIRAYLKWIKR